MSAFAEKPRLTRLPGGPISHTRRWVADVSELCKARITLMVLVTTLVGFYLPVERTYTRAVESRVLPARDAQ